MQFKSEDYPSLPQLRDDTFISKNYGMPLSP